MYFCTTCGTSKAKEAFNRIRSENNMSGTCKVCANNRSKEWRLKNKEKIKQNSIQYRQSNRKNLIQYNKNYYQQNKSQWKNYNKEYIERIGQHALKQYKIQYSKERYLSYKTWLDEVRDVPCADCNQKFPPVCMQFDHIPERGEKKFNLANGYGRSDDDINIEYAKCEIVCANCHMIRTHILRKGKSVNI